MQRRLLSVAPRLLPILLAAALTVEAAGVEIAASSLVPGQAAAMEGRGWRPGDTVELWIGATGDHATPPRGFPEGFTRVSTFVADREGGFRAQVTFPPGFGLAWDLKDGKSHVLIFRDGATLIRQQSPPVCKPVFTLSASSIFRGETLSGSLGGWDPRRGVYVWIDGRTGVRFERNPPDPSKSTFEIPTGDMEPGSHTIEVEQYVVDPLPSLLGEDSSDSQTIWKPITKRPAGGLFLSASKTTFQVNPRGGGLVVGTSSPSVLPGGTLLLWAAVMDSKGALERGRTRRVHVELGSRAGTKVLLSDASPDDCIAPGDGVYVGWQGIAASAGAEEEVRFFLDGAEQQRSRVRVDGEPRVLVLTDFERLRKELLQTGPEVGQDLLQKNGIPDFYDLVAALHLKATEDRGVVVSLEREIAGYPRLQRREPADDRDRRGYLIEEFLGRLTKATLPLGSISIAIVGDDYVVPARRIEVKGTTKEDFLAYRGLEKVEGPWTSDAYRGNGYHLTDVPYADPGGDRERPWPKYAVGRVLAHSPQEYIAILERYSRPIDLDASRSSARVLFGASDAGFAKPLCEQYLIPALQRRWPGSSSGREYLPGVTHVAGLKTRWFSSSGKWGPSEFFRALDAQGGLTFVFTHGKFEGFQTATSTAIDASGPAGSSIDGWRAPDDAYGRLLVLLACHTGIAADSSVTDLATFMVAHNLARKGVTFIAPTCAGTFAPYPDGHGRFYLAFLRAVTDPSTPTVGEAFRRAVCGTEVVSPYDRLAIYGTALYGWPLQPLTHGTPPTPPETRKREAERRVVNLDDPEGSKVLVVDVPPLQSQADAAGRVLFTFAEQDYVSFAPGTPILPVLYRWLYLPSESAVESVRVLRSDSREHPEPVDLAIASPLWLPAAGKGLRPAPSGASAPTTPCPERMVEFDIFPPDHEGIKDVLVRLTIIPLRYDPATRRVTLFDRIEVGIDYRGPQARREEDQAANRPESDIEVPSFRGLTESEAERIARSAGLRVLVTPWQGAAVDPKDLLCGRQEPVAGTPVPPGSTVVVDLEPSNPGASEGESKPEETGGEGDPAPAVEVTVPSVVGLCAKEAKARIDAAGFETRLEIAAEAPPAGAAYTCREQAPVGGTRARRGTPVTLSIYGPPRREAQTGVIVPSVVGLGAKEAAGILSPNFQVSFEVAKAPPKDPSQAHCVIAQAPPAGASLSAGSTVVLTIHPPAAKKAPPTATGPIVPNFVGKHSKDLKAITPAGITLDFEIAADPPSCEEDAYCVLAQDRPAGKRVPQGTVVVLTISGPARRPDPAPRVPSVVGLSQAEAIRVLSEAGLEVTDISGVGPAPSPDQANCVMRQRPEAGAPIPADRRMAIVCYGDCPEEHPKPPDDDPPPSDDSCPDCKPGPACLCLLGVHMDECPATQESPDPGHGKVDTSWFVGEWAGEATVTGASSDDSGAELGALGEMFKIGCKLPASMSMGQDDAGLYMVVKGTRTDWKADGDGLFATRDLGDRRQTWRLRRNGESLGGTLHIEGDDGTFVDLSLDLERR